MRFSWESVAERGEMLRGFLRAAGVADPAAPDGALGSLTAREKVKNSVTLAGGKPLSE
jgi:hypothetical protein